MRMLSTHSFPSKSPVGDLMTASTFQVEPRTSAAAAATVPPGFRFPSMTTTVPKELVHRAAVAEVMLTDWRRVGDTRFALTAQWSRGHSFYRPVDGHHDPLLAAETIRQAATLLAHAEFGVPRDYRFLLKELAFAIEPDRLAVGGAPASLDIDITCTTVKRRGERVAGLDYVAVLRRDGRPAATGSLSAAFLAPAVYRRLRKEHSSAADQAPLPPACPVLPESVGRTSPADVVLSPTDEANRWQLRTDTRHPILFDHPVDHVPGMTLIEAARQAATSVLGRSCQAPTSVAGTFLQFVELDAPCEIVVQDASEWADDDRHLLVTGHQDGTRCFSAVVAARAPHG